MRCWHAFIHLPWQGTSQVDGRLQPCATWPGLGRKPWKFDGIPIISTGCLWDFYEMLNIVKP